VIGFFAGNASAAAQAVSAGDLEALRRADPTPNATNVRLTAASCASATEQCAVDVKLEELTTDSHGNVKGNELAHATYPAQAMEHLRSLFTASAAPDAPAAS
jgi:hypothetical protein